MAEDGPTEAPAAEETCEAAPAAEETCEVAPAAEETCLAGDGAAGEASTAGEEAAFVSSHDIAIEEEDDFSAFRSPGGKEKAFAEGISPKSPGCTKQGTFVHPLIALFIMEPPPMPPPPPPPAANDEDEDFSQFLSPKGKDAFKAAPKEEELAEEDFSQFRSPGGVEAAFAGSTRAKVVYPNGVAWRRRPNFDDRIEVPAGPMPNEVVQGTLILVQGGNRSIVEYLQVKKDGNDLGGE